MEDYLISQRKNIARSNSDLAAVTELGSKGDETVSKISVILFYNYVPKSQFVTCTYVTKWEKIT